MAHEETRKKPPLDARFHASRGILLTQGLRLTTRVVAAALLARLISPQEYGVFGMAALAHGLAYMIQDLGLAAVTLRQPAITADERTALFWLNAGIGAILALVVAAFGPLVAAFYGEPLLKKLLPALAVTFLLNGLHAQLRAQLARENRFGDLNRIEIVAFMLSSAVALLAAWRGAGCWALAALPLTAELAIAAGVWRTQNWRPGRWPRGFSPRAVLALGAGISGHEVLRYLYRNLDQFLIGRWFGSSALGLYGRAVQFIVLPGQYLSDPLGPWVIASLGRNHDAPGTARAFWCHIVNGLAHLTWPVAVIFLCLPAEVLRIAFGPAWVQGAPMLRGLTGTLAAQPLLTAITWLLIAAGRGRRLSSWSAFTLAGVVIACVVARSSGPAALAGAISVVMLLSVCAAAAFVLDGLPVGPRDLLASIARPISLATIATLAVLGALSLVPSLGAVPRFGLGLGITAGCWGAGCAARGVREELTGHFLRRRT